MKSTHPFQFPFVIKQVGEFLTVSVPDFEISVGEQCSPGASIDRNYVTLLNRLTLKAAKKVYEKLGHLESAGKKHYRPASFVKQTIQIQNKEQINTATAAKYLSVSQATLKRWELAGVIKAQKSRGGHRRFVLSELDRVKEQIMRGLRPLTHKEFEFDRLRGFMENPSAK